ncbi:MAG: hypothetical protein HC898_03545 [Phycisphaerales bacterium]|nr:hypothetical protein [Phycisphaerales bacterium]
MDNAAITINGSGLTTTLNADIITAGNAIAINDSILVGTPALVTLDTTNGGGVAAGADIDITGTINDDAAGTSSLDLEAGSGGQVTLGGAIGGNDALNNLYIRSGNAAGLTLAYSINIDGILRIVSGGIVNQTGGSLTAPLLGVIASGNVTLNGAGNDADTLAVSNTLADANVSFTDTDGLDVGQVTAYLNFTLTNGIATSGNGNTTLVAGDSVTQTQAINTNQLAVKTRNDGGAGITLGQPNDVNSIDLQVRNAADDTTVVGDVVFTDTDGFVVTLIRTASNATLENGGAVTQTGAITADGLELLGTGVYTLTNAGNDVNTLAANVDDSLSFFDADDLTIGTVNATAGITTTDDDVTLQTVTTLAIDDAINVGAGNLTLDADNTVSQNDTITAAGIELLGDGPFVLTNAGNDVDTLAANLTGALSFRDVDDLIIGTVNATNGVNTTATGDFNLIAGGAVSQTQAIIARNLVVKTLNDVGAAITLNNLLTNNVISIDLMARNAADNANAAGDIAYRDTDDFDVVAMQTLADMILHAGGMVTQTGAITGMNLELLGTGPFTLGFTNDVDTLAANITQALTFNDVDGLIIGTVNATNGITTTGDAVNVNITGDLDINQAITTTGGA